MQVNFTKIALISSCLFLLNFTVSAQCDSPPELLLLDDFTHHCVGETLYAEILNSPEISCNEDAGNYTYCYTDNELTTFSYCPDTPGDGSAITLFFQAGTFENGFDYIEIFDGADGTGSSLGQFEGSVAGMSFVPMNTSGCISFVISTDFSISCAGGQQTELSYELGCSLSPSYYTVEWSPSEYLANPNSLSTEIFGLAADQEFTLTVFENGNTDCIATESVMVTYESTYHLGVDSENAACSSAGPVNLTSLLSGNADDVGVWYNPNGNAIATNLDPSSAEAGIYTYTYEFCPENSVSLDLIIADAPTLEVSEDFSVSCNGESLEVTIFGAGTDASCSINAGDYEFCYGNDQDLFFTYCPDIPGEGNPMRLDFTGGYVEVNYDLITVYDGNDNGDPVIESFDGTPAGRSYVATNPDGCISFRLQTDYSINCQEGSFQEGPITWTVYCSDDLYAYNVSWSPSELVLDSSSAQTEIYGLTEDTEFTVSVNSIIAPACVETASVNVTFLDDISLGIDTEINLCEDADAINIFDELEGNPDDFGFWTDSEGNAVSTDFDPQLNESGQYFYSHPDCQHPTTVDVIIRPIPNVNAGNNVGLCQGESTTLTASGADSYSWAGLGSGTSITVSPLQTTNYTVTGTTEYGCSAQDQVTVSILNSDQITITEDNGVLSVDQGGQFQWYLNGFPILGANQSSINITFSGTYTVAINPGSNCSVTSDPYEAIVGVDELSNSSISVYPQPAQYWIQIDADQSILNLKLYTLDGRVVSDQMINNSNYKLDCSSLTAGMYMMKLKLADGNVVRKAIIRQ